MSAITGRTRFDDDDKAAFGDAVPEAAVKSSGDGRAALSALAAERPWVFDDFEPDHRSVVSGISGATSLLAATNAEDRDDVRRAWAGLSPAPAGRSGHASRRRANRRLYGQESLA